MTRRHLVTSLGFVLGYLGVTGGSAEVLGFADSKLDPLITDLVGDWRITYIGGAVREYGIDSKGILHFQAENRSGQVYKKSEALLVVFSGDVKTERLTMGVDGRLFVEHFTSKDDLVNNKPLLIGIGIRQK